MIGGAQGRQRRADAVYRGGHRITVIRPSLDHRCLGRVLVRRTPELGGGTRVTSARQVARFGPFEFDFDQKVLSENAAPVDLQPQPTEVLAILVGNPGRLVTRDELRDAVWGDRILEFDPGLNFSIRQVRRALRDDAKSPAYVETVHRRGYRFVAPVQFEPSKREWSTSRTRPFMRIAAGVALVGAIGFLVNAGSRWLAPSSSENTGPAPSLPDSMRATYRAAEWLQEQGEYGRALVRLDSVRRAAPHFARAWALTAYTQLRLGQLTEARIAAERAIDIDPDRAEAYDALGRIYFMEMQGARALTAFRRAVELDPTSIPYRQWYAETLANALRLDEAIRQLEQARRIDPISNLIGVDLAQVYLAARRYDDAARFCAGSLELVASAEPWARDCLMTAYHFQGKDSLATDQAHRLMQLEGASAVEVTDARTLPDYFRWDHDRLAALASSGEHASPFLRVRAAARLRWREETLAGLDSLRTSRHYGLQWAPRDVWFYFLHGDPQYESILTEAGLPTPPPAPPPS